MYSRNSFVRYIFAPVLSDPYDLSNLEVVSVGNILNEFDERLSAFEEWLDVDMSRTHELETTRVFSRAKDN